MTIYFDMDGTIADLYGVENWLPKLRAEDASPYAEATPLTDMENLQLLLAILQNLNIVKPINLDKLIPLLLDNF